MASSPKVLVALSGGCESVALLYHAKQLGYEVEALHVAFSTMSGMEYPRCVEICKKLNVPLFNTEIYYGDPQFDKLKIVDTTYWTPALAWMACRKDCYDYVWFGIHNLDSLPFVGRVCATFDMLKSICGHDIKAKIDAPLCKTTKKHQYDMIDVDIQSLLMYCEHNKLRPCGNCNKCKEWKTAIDV